MIIAPSLTQIWTLGAFLVFLCGSPSLGLPVKGKQVSSQNVEYDPPIEHLATFDAERLARTDPAVYKDKLRRPATAQMIDHLHRLTSDLKTKQLKAHSVGDRADLEQHTSTLKALRPHVKAVQGGHDRAMLLNLSYQKKTKEQVEEENAEQQRKMNEIVINVNQHPELMPELERKYLFSKSFKNIALPTPKSLKTTLSLPSSFKGKSIMSKGKERSPDSSTHSESSSGTKTR